MRSWIIGGWLAVGCAPDVQFIDLRVEDIGATEAVVRFETSLPATCSVEYGLTAEALALSATDPSMDPEDPYATDHEVPLFDLVPQTTYAWRAAVVEADGRETRSEVQEFTTLAGTAFPPSVSTDASVTGVSSNWNGAANDSSFGADHAIDGSLATEWATDGDGDGAWISFALPEARELGGVAIRSRKMADGTSIVLQFTLALDGVDAGTFDTPDPDQVYVFTFPPVHATEATVSATSTTGGNTGLREVALLAP